MTKLRVRLSTSLRTLFLLAAGGLASGCGPVVEDITVRSPGEVVADPHAVTVVVIQLQFAISTFERTTRVYGKTVGLIGGGGSPG